MALLLHPSTLLATLLVTGYASIFHLWTGRSTRDLLLYLAASATGFAAGQWVGLTLQLEFMRIGQLWTLEGSLSSIGALILVRLIYS